MAAPSNRHAATRNQQPWRRFLLPPAPSGRATGRRGDSHEHETTDSRRLLRHCPWRRHRMGRALRHGPHKQGRRFRTCVAKQQPDHRHEHGCAASANRDDESRERRRCSLIAGYAAPDAGPADRCATGRRRQAGQPDKFPGGTATDACPAVGGHAAQERRADRRQGLLKQRNDEGAVVIAPRTTRAISRYRPQEPVQRRTTPQLDRHSSKPF